MKTSTTMKPILKWQYDSLVQELLLLQQHTEDPTCPCESESEMCARKHLLTIEALAKETSTIETETSMRDKLLLLAEWAREERKEEEKKLCGKEAKPFDAARIREWRKQFEAKSLACKVQPKAHLKSEVETGFVICTDGNKVATGPVAEGTADRVSVPTACPSQMKPLAVYHTHLTGEPVPSQQDIEEVAKMKIPMVCVEAKGQAKCYSVPKEGAEMKQMNQDVRQQLLECRRLKGGLLFTAKWASDYIRRGETEEARDIINKAIAEVESAEVKGNPTAVKEPADLVVEQGKYYYPLGIWAIKKSSRTAAAEFAERHNLPYAFQWQGVGSFVSHQAPPSRKDILILTKASDNPVAVKEPWQMTLEEYASEQARHYGEPSPRMAWVKAGYGQHYRDHRASVKYALSEGKPVPAEVLKDYPELMVKATGNPKEPAKIKYWLWVWRKGGKVKNAWEFDSEQEALDYFNQHFKDEPVKYTIEIETEEKVGNPIAGGVEMSKTKPSCKLVKNYYHCRIKPKGHFDPQSFRTVSPKEGVRITIGCPKGKFDKEKQVCKVGTESQKILYRKDVYK